MKRIMAITVLFLAFLAFQNFYLYAEFNKQSGGSSGKSCSASAFLGGSCSIGQCQAGQCCKCEGGFLSAKCECYPCGGSPSYLRSIPEITNRQKQDAIEFENWTSSQQSTSIQSLAPIVQEILNAIDSNDQNSYSLHEKAFRDTFVSMSSADQDLCNQWAAARGY